MPITAAKDVDVVIPTVATVSTAAVTHVTDRHRTERRHDYRGRVAAVSARGVCWNTTGTPTTADSKTVDGAGSGAFVSNLTSLNADTTYHVRAYATNPVAPPMGMRSRFRRRRSPAGCNHGQRHNIAATTVKTGRQVTNDGNEAITARGVCWNTSGQPTIADSKTDDGVDSGTFVSYPAGLRPVTMYYLRAYATNLRVRLWRCGLLYTAIAVPAVTTSDITVTNTTTAEAGGNVTDAGGATVTARGVCWNTTGSPMVSDGKTADGAGEGLFISRLENLLPAVTYYVRAYATNSAGTGYGEEVEFEALVAGRIIRSCSRLVREEPSAARLSRPSLTAGRVGCYRDGAGEVSFQEVDRYRRFHEYGQPADGHQCHVGHDHYRQLHRGSGCDGDDRAG